MNLINIIIAENERDSPFQPLSVRNGFKPGENVVTLMLGWGVLSAKNWAANVWGKEMNYPKIIKDIFSQQDPMFGACAVLSPPIAHFVKDAGYDTIEKFTQWLATPEPGQQPIKGRMTIIVTGGSNNNYYSIGGFVPVGKGIQIDKWR